MNSSISAHCFTYAFSTFHVYIYVGSAVATYSLANGNSWVLYQTIQLDASLKAGVNISPSCRTAYIRALRDLMTTTFRYINYQYVNYDDLKFFCTLT